MKVVMKRVIIAVAAGTIVACGGVGGYKSDFPVVIVNRTANTLQALANGNAVGNVAAGTQATFTVNLPESQANTFNNGVAPTPQADVTFTAKDTRTGALSAEKAVTLSTANPTTVSFDPTDFPSTGPTISRFTVSPTNPTINQDITFNGTSSTVSNGTFAWDFGDGSSDTGMIVTHRYTRNGTFTIVLSVTSDTKATSTSSRTLTVSGTLSAANANFTFSPTQPSINQAVIFTANASAGGPGFGPGGPVPGPTANFTFAWDFGDGGTGTGSPANHVYARGGTYTVTLRATADTGLSAVASRPITVQATLPAGSANFTFSPTDPAPGDSVFFNASSSTASGGSYKWDFGDGSSDSGVAPVHAYSSAHTYTVTLTVTNALGQSATVSKTVTVAVPSS